MNISPLFRGRALSGASHTSMNLNAFTGENRYHSPVQYENKGGIHAATKIEIQPAKS
jgi:hypothetical protein